MSSDSSRSPSPPRKRNYLSDALSRGVVNPVLRVMDVDGIVRRVDINDLVQRVDWNDLLTEELDMNAVLDQVDFDRLLARIDVNRVIDRVDVNKIIERSNLKSIIARSTSGMCSHILNTLRAQIIRVDQISQRYGRCACCFWKQDRRRWLLPPRPTVTAVRQRRDRHEDRSIRKAMYCPKKPTKLAIAVQGRNAGVISRFLAYAIDRALLLSIFAIFLIIVTDIAQLIAKNHQHAPVVVETNKTSIRTSPPKSKGASPYYLPLWVPFLMYYLLAVIYDACCLGAVGRTLGKVVFGLIVIHPLDGKPLTVFQAIYRSVINNTPLVAASAFLALMREDRRGIVDIMTQTTVVYAWDAHNFRLAEEQLARDMVFGDLDANLRSFSDFDDSSISTKSQASQNVPQKRRNVNEDLSPIKAQVLKFPPEGNMHGTTSVSSQPKE